MSINKYSELKVWQKSITYTTMIYNISSNFPEVEKFGLTSQLKRSAVSIPSNIAEGFGRMGSKEFIRFLNIAKGSLFENQTQIVISRKLNFISSDDFDTLFNFSVEIELMLKALIKSLGR